MSHMILEEIFGKEVKARTNHICVNCRLIIQKDEVYHFNKYFDIRTREAEVYKLHLKCVAIYYYKRSELERHTDHWEQWYEEVFV